MKKKLIIVDDDYPSRFVLKELSKGLLKKLSVEACFNVITLSSGQEAIDYVTHDTSKSVKVIFMDLQMAGIDGFVASSLINKMRKDIKIIIYTACIRDSFLTALADELNNSFTDVLIKPIDECVLNEILIHHCSC